MSSNRYGNFFNNLGSLENFDSNMLTNQGSLGDFFGLNSGDQSILGSNQDPLSNFSIDGLAGKNGLSLDGAPTGQIPTTGDKDDGFNFDKLAQGIGIGKDVLAGIMALKQFSMAKDAYKHQKGMDLTNLYNQEQQLTHQIALDNRRRDIEGQGAGNGGNGYFSGIAPPDLRGTPT